MEKQSQKYELIAKTFFGLEDVLADELILLGATDIIKHNRAVSFHGDLELLYSANYNLRTALRILKPILKFKVSTNKVLYRKVNQINWVDYFGLEDTFAIDTVVNSEYFKHSKFVALKTKDAIADHFRAKYKKRPSVNVDNPTIRIHVHIFKDQCTISLDSSGDSLHKRGYRIAKTPAPLNEALAAGMILLSGWDKKSTFIDPMCGSGTIPIEAAMIALSIPPAYFRKSFGFQKWNDFDYDIWKQVVNDIKIRDDIDFRIIASDKSLKAIDAAKENISQAKLDKFVSVHNNILEDLEPDSDYGVLIMNPPYGERLKENHITDLYMNIGDSLKNNFSGFEAWILSSSKTAMKKVGLKTSKRLTLFNGALECKYYNYSLYKGSKKYKDRA